MSQGTTVALNECTIGPRNKWRLLFLAIGFPSPRMITDSVTRASSSHTTERESHYSGTLNALTVLVRDVDHFHKQSFGNRFQRLHVAKRSQPGQLLLHLILKTFRQLHVYEMMSKLSHSIVNKGISINSEGSYEPSSMQQQDLDVIHQTEKNLIFSARKKAFCRPFSRDPKSHLFSHQHYTALHHAILHITLERLANSWRLKKSFKRTFPGDVEEFEK